MSESIDPRDAAPMDAIEGLVTGEMSRDEFVKRMAGPGLLGQRDRRHSGRRREGNCRRPGASRSPGTTVNMLIAAEGDEKGVKDKTADFKKLTGIKLNMTALPVGPAPREGESRASRRRARRTT